MKWILGDIKDLQRFEVSKSGVQIDSLRFISRWLDFSMMDIYPFILGSFKSVRIEPYDRQSYNFQIAYQIYDFELFTKLRNNARH